MNQPMSAVSPASNEPLRVGVIGLGTIGRGITTSLARRGRVPAVFDLRLDAAEGLPGPSDVLRSPSAVADKSDVVFISVVDALQVSEVITGPDGLLAGAHDGLIVLVTATIPVAVIRELAELSAERAVTLLDCGVTRGSRAAEAGLLALVGGPADALARARPVLEDCTAEVVHCGPLGTGMATKIASQVVTAGRWRAVHEAVELAASAGVEPATLVEVLETSDPEGNALLGLQRLRMAGRTVDDFARPVRHYLRNVDKDMQAAQQLAGETGIAVPLVDLFRARAADIFAWLGETDDATA
jgi:3-hydroxyisobutyrate dehydrogenase-like beta-hydroxyacid dehydrogenase